MKYIVLLLPGFLLSTASLAEPAQGLAVHPANFKCGNAQVRVFNSGHTNGPAFRVSVSRQGHQLNVLYSIEQEYLAIRCEKNHTGHPVLLVNNICSGTGCADSNFGIIDPQQLKILLAPDQRWKGNVIAAESIIGQPIETFSCKVSPKTLYGDSPKGEYCYTSYLKAG
jgi:hypothetical protein